MIYYTSDLHFCHKNIIHLCNRPFKDIDEMNEVLIKNWNGRVRKNDTIYILGDFAYPKNDKDIQDIIKILKRLNGQKVLIVGNHDNKLVNKEAFRKEFIRIEHYLEIYDNNQKVILFHYPIEEWNGYYRNVIHLYGHVHNNDVNLANIPNRYNVGVDVNGYIPVTKEELIANNPK